MLVILLAAASFVITLRVSEYIIIRQEITRIENYYRSIGYLWPLGAGGNMPVPVFRAVASARGLAEDAGYVLTAVETRPYLDFTDNTWQDVISNDQRVTLADSRRIYSAQLLNMTNGYIREGNFLHRGMGDYHSDAVLTATLLEGYSYWSSPNMIGGNPLSGITEYLVKYFIIEEVFAAHLEHAQPGQELALIVPIWDIDNMPTDDLLVGNTYLMRAWHHQVAYSRVRNERSVYPSPLFPPALVLAPLHTGGNVYFLNTSDANFGQEFQDITPLIELINYHNRRLEVIATVDGTASHVNQGLHDYRLREGRWTNYQDYLDANPVAVIHIAFARRRNLRIGSMLQIAPPMGSEVQAMYLEIIGFYDRGNLGGGDAIGAFFDVGTIFVPASLPLYNFAHQYQQMYTLTDSLYSFVLSSPRYQEQFTRDMAPQLFAMGYVLVFVPTNFELFVSVADPIIQTLILNLIIFSVSGIAVLLLVGFIYMRMTNKNFALYRALGIPKRVTLRKVLAPLVLFAIPAIGIGAVAAWWYATTSADGTLAPLYELEPHLLAGSSLELAHIAWFAGGVAVVAIGIVFVMAYRFSKKPVLQLLQQSSR